MSMDKLDGLVTDEKSLKKKREKTETEDETNGIERKKKKRNKDYEEPLSLDEERRKRKRRKRDHEEDDHSRRRSARGVKNNDEMNVERLRLIESMLSPNTASFCDANTAEYFPLQEEIAFLESKLSDLNMMYNNLEDDHRELQRDYNALQHAVKNANLIARDQAVFEKVKTQYNVTYNELQQCRKLIAELQEVGWDLLPEQLAAECKKANDRVEEMVRKVDMAAHNESLAKTIASEAIKKIKLSEGTLESQREMIIDLKNQLDVSKEIHEKTIKNLNREWESKMLRKHLRDKRRQATLHHQIDSIRAYLRNTDDDRRDEVLLELSLLYKYPTPEEIAKKIIEVNGEKFEAQTRKGSAHHSLSQRQWEVIALIEPEITEKLKYLAANCKLDSSKLSHPEDCERLITSISKQLTQLQEKQTTQLVELTDQPTGSGSDTGQREEPTGMSKEDLAVLEMENVNLHKKLEEKYNEIKELKDKVKQMGDEYEKFRMDAKTEAELRSELTNLMTSNRALIENYQSEVVLRKKYYNMMEDMKGKIRVYCRTRPPSQVEMSQNGGSKVIVNFPDIYTLQVTSKHGVKEFQFDRVFDTTSPQEEVFEDTSNLLQSAIDGFNVCIFGYGQTGSGKTFTLIGTEEQPGLAPRSFDRLFELLTNNEFSNKYTYEVDVTMVELYNDKLLDLLNETAEHCKMEIKKNLNGTIAVPGATRMKALNAKSLNEIFAKGNATRHIACTKMNSESSRSHLILSVQISTKNKMNGTLNQGKFSIIDLAGSERLAKSGVSGEVAKEAQAINVSLSALGDVISALTTDQSFIPYRNSKLTMLMQDSIGGNAKTLMFVNISPVEYNMSETISSLNYATRVKMVKNEQSKNAESQMVQQLKETIERLKQGERV